MKIAVEGCAHGELEKIYDTIKLLEEREGIKVDLLICCGDFQACRNEQDLLCMAVPPKYYNMCSFYKYYNGEKTAPILTIFIGGNHEASSYLQELPYGGWVAPNIYYLGYAGVINIAGVRIGGISGIYKGHDYLRGHFEKAPYTNDTKRSVYHVRNLEVFRLKQISQSIDVFVSHDWPTGIWNYGDAEQLLKFKPFFKTDMELGKLGSKPCEELLHRLQPDYWFAAHLHCKFAAFVEHSDEKTTRFLALDKCLPRRRFLQVTDVPHDPNLKIEISYDLEWLTILHLTNYLLSVKSIANYMPGMNSLNRCDFTPTLEEKSNVSAKFFANLLVPDNFVKTAETYNLQQTKQTDAKQSAARINPQTTLFCSKLEIDDPLVLLDVDNKVVPLDVTDLENDLVVSEVEEESDAYESFIKNTPSKVALKLPEPKFADTTREEESFDSDKTKSFEKEIEESEKVDGKVPETNEPVKKFKRRNASIYSSEDV